MRAPRINKIEIQGFRAFGAKPQTLVFSSPIAAVWGANSQGKTSLAEAFEFLLTGATVRRELLASVVRDGSRYVGPETEGANRHNGGGRPGTVADSPVVLLSP